jgi:hypothetical protein
MSKHAPGPWRLSATDDTLVRSADNGLVAVAHGDYGCDWEVMEANARLIASAPELLQELENALMIFEFGEDDKTVLAPKWVARARAAIAKATGEAA